MKRPVRVGAGEKLVLTANRLLDGTIVWRDRLGQWRPVIGAAEKLDAERVGDVLELAQIRGQKNQTRFRIRRGDQHALVAGFDLFEKSGNARCQTDCLKVGYDSQEKTRLCNDRSTHCAKGGLLPMLAQQQKNCSSHQGQCAAESQTFTQGKYVFHLVKEDRTSDAERYSDDSPEYPIESQSGFAPPRHKRLALMSAR